jgi:hypothetical protein
MKIVISFFHQSTRTSAVRESCKYETIIAIKYLPLASSAALILTTVWMGALHLKSNAAVTFCGHTKVSD